MALYLHSAAAGAGRRRGPERCFAAVAGTALPFVGASQRLPRSPALGTWEDGVLISAACPVSGLFS